MLYFSKIKILVIYVIVFILSYFALTNFLNSQFKISNKKVNLGLDLQGGSYLLLEVDSTPIIKEKIQIKCRILRSFSWQSGGFN